MAKIVADVVDVPVDLLMPGLQLANGPFQHLHSIIRSSWILARWMSSRSAMRCSNSFMRESKWEPQLSATMAAVYWADAKLSSEEMWASVASSYSCRE
jgi:hypothetical protein